MLLRNLFLKHSLIRLLQFAAIALPVVAVFSNLWPKEMYLNMFFSSDALYLPSLYQDLVKEGHSIKDWHLNPSPNFFPDMFVYFLLMFVTNNFIWSTFLFTLLQCVIFAALVMALFRVVFPGRSYWYETNLVVFLSLFSFEFLYVSHDLGYTFLLFINSYHNGAFLSALFCFLLVLKHFSESRRWHLYLLFAVVLLSMFSDRLFIILFPVPLILSLVVMAPRIGWATFARIVVVVLPAAGLGWYLFSVIDNNTYRVFKESEILDLAAISNSFSVFADHLVLILTAFGFKALTIYLYIISFLALVFLTIRSFRWGSSTVLILFLVFNFFFSLCVIAAPIINGKYSDYACIRYNIFPVYLTGLNAMVFVAGFLHRPPLKRGGIIVSASLLVIVMGSAVIKINGQGLKEFFRYYPHLVQQIDELAETHNLKNGVGNYWVAKKVSMFSKKGVRIRSVFDDLSIYDHVANDKWFFNNMFTFVVLNKFFDTTLYRSKLKNLKNLRYDSEVMILEADSFTYRKETGYRVNSGD